MALREFAIRSRRFTVDVVLIIAALSLAVAAFTATTDPYLLVALAVLIGVALLVEPVAALVTRPWSTSASEATPVRG